MNEDDDFATGGPSSSTDAIDVAAALKRSLTPILTTAQATAIRDDLAALIVNLRADISGQIVVLRGDLTSQMRAMQNNAIPPAVHDDPNIQIRELRLDVRAQMKRLPSVTTFIAGIILGQILTGLMVAALIFLLR